MTDPHAGRPSPLAWRAFTVCAVVAALTILDVSKINVGIPVIEEALDGGPTELQLLIAGYSLAFGLSLVPAGRLGDLHSRRAMFIIGLVGFTLASLWCALAPDIVSLVVGRLLQGVAGGILMPQTLGMIQQLFTGAHRGRAFGAFGASIGVATAIGPTVGGLLVTIGGPVDGWRLLFWMNVPLGALALIFALWLLPDVQPSEPGERSLDLFGALLLGLTVFSLMLPFALTTGTDLDDPARWLWLIAFVVFGAVFLWWERRYVHMGRSPIVHLSLFRLGTFRSGVIIAASHFASMPAIFLLLTLLVQQGMGYPPVIAGLMSMPFAVATTITSWLGGRLLERFGARIVAFGSVVMVVGFLMVIAVGTFAPVELVPLLVAACCLIAGAGSGFIVSPNQALTLSQVPVTRGGVAGAVGQVGQRMGTAIGIAVAASVFYGLLNTMGGTGAGADAFRSAFTVGSLIALSLLLVAVVFAFVEVRTSRAR